MKSRQRRRPVRPLTIYGYRRGHFRSRRIWLALLVLASLSILPRVLSPIAEKFWGESAHRKAPPVRAAVPLVGPVAEPGNAFASPEPETGASLEAPADSTAKATLPPAPGVRQAPAPEVSGIPPAAPARPALHGGRAAHGSKAARSAAHARQGQGLVPAP